MSTPSPENPGLFNWLLVITLGVIWGGAFMSVRLSLDGFGPWTVAAWRTGLGGIALAIIGAMLGQGMHKIPSVRAWIFAGIIGAGAVALPFALLSWGQQFIPSAFAGVAMGAVPLLVLPLVYLFSKEEGIGPRRVLGMLLGFVGLFILVGPGAAASTGHENEWLGRIACLAAAGCYAAGSVVTRRAPKMPPIAFATATLLLAAVILVPIAALTEGWPNDFPATPTAALIYVALFPTALAAVIRVRVITTAGSLFMSLTSYQVPVWSVILGVSFMGETLPPQLFFALAIILAGIGLSQSRALMAMIRR
ncbi:drug/metabolite transporter (DMT)-like permease [Litoreibacter halocynthiae]|uniref:Drug/metabolite transporter (DMT)-like permease n=1 Tax=Litoreibacter halocynthiae TaxID=1242689 RepID=A0A4R7LHQ3_9RHOB|nr:DMT family transporter [Litoreibacter halocynthiae]TDT74769.1 drug/metabolite transporter (DMT)-like permease [Litoreibacter halocynthiae]